MNQYPNTSSCGCDDDQKQLLANTSIVLINSGNNALDGSNSVFVLLAAAGANGTIIKSITVKATMPVTDGMVRLFVSDGAGNFALYKEVPIPTTPALTNTPTPAPILPTFEIKLCGGLQLNQGYKLYASTQNTESFNVMVEGLDWTYQTNLPSGGCSFKRETAITGINTVNTANASLSGSGSILPIFKAPITTPSNNGSLVKSITIKATQSTNEGMVRLFLSRAHGTSYSLYKEIYIPQTTQSGFDPSFKVVLDEDLCIAPDCWIGASTQWAQSFAITVEGASWLYPMYP